MDEKTKSEIANIVANILGKKYLNIATEEDISNIINSSLNILRENIKTLRTDLQERSRKDDGGR